MLIAAVVWAGNPSLVWADPPQRSATEKVDKSKRSLERLNRELKQVQKKQADANRREKSILNELERYDQQLLIKRRELITLEERIRERDSEIQSLRQQLDTLQGALQSQRSLVGERLSAIYKQGRIPYLKVLVGSQDYHDLLKRYTYLQRLTQKEAELLAGYELGVGELEQKEQRLEEAKAALISHRTELQAKLSETRTEKRNKDMLLARIRGEKVTYEQTIRELEESSQKLQALIKELEQQRRRARQPKGPSKQPELSGELARHRGSLNWPVDGILVSRFGLQKHPQFDTYVYRKGIEIGSFQGGAIRSIYGGQVVYADWFPGYGMVIILDHGEEYYSLYAHLAKLLVAVGDRVHKDQVIGEVGDTGVSEGGRLYFELRHREQAVDPLEWLKPKT